MAKITISLPDEMLASLDEEARALGGTRSGLIQEATASYLGKSREERARERRRAGVDRALEVIEEMQSLPPKDDRPTLEILREIRETNGGCRPGE